MASGKDTMSCCKDNCGKDMCSKDKTAASRCGHGCGQDGKSCCSPKKAEKTEKSCCRKELHS